MTTPIDIVVVREAETWWIRYGSVELDYAVQAEALADAIAIAHAFGKEGQFTSVRSGVMTSVYGPDGFIRAVPTAKRSSPAPSTEPRKAPGDVKPKKSLTPRTTSRTMDERSRTSRIASAFEVIRSGPA
jgi:hypothetical protein